MIELKINKNNKHQRLDKYLLKYFNEAPKSFIYKIIRKKYIKLNDKKVTGSEILEENDILKIYLSDETIAKFKSSKEIKVIKKDFKIIYEDENLIICYKPINLVSQPDKNNKENSLNNQLISYIYEKGEYDTSSVSSASICNRLDRNTSGIVIFGKNLETLQAINKAFKENSIEKFYISAVYGKIEKGGKIKLYHSKNDENKAIVSESFKEGYKEILTEYEPLVTKNNKTLIKIKLLTGKSHQIRASFLHIKKPIIGDKKYSKEDAKDFQYIKNQFLHCYKVKFKEKEGFLKYLYNKSFICKYMDNSYKKVFDYFSYKIEE